MLQTLGRMKAQLKNGTQQAGNSIRAETTEADQSLQRLTEPAEAPQTPEGKVEKTLMFEGPATERQPIFTTANKGGVSVTLLKIVSCPPKLHDERVSILFLEIIADLVSIFAIHLLRQSCWLPPLPYHRTI